MIVVIAKCASLEMISMMSSNPSSGLLGRRDSESEREDFEG